MPKNQNSVPMDYDSSSDDNSSDVEALIFEGNRDRTYVSEIVGRGKQASLNMTGSKTRPPTHLGEKEQGDHVIADGLSRKLYEKTISDAQSVIDNYEPDRKLTMVIAALKEVARVLLPGENAKIIEDISEDGFDRDCYKKRKQELWKAIGDCSALEEPLHILAQSENITLEQQVDIVKQVEMNKVAKKNTKELIKAHAQLKRYKLASIIEQMVSKLREDFQKQKTTTFPSTLRLDKKKGEGSEVKKAMVLLGFLDACYKLSNLISGESINKDVLSGEFGKILKMISEDKSGTIKFISEGGIGASGVKIQKEAKINFFELGKKFSGLFKPLVDSIVSSEDPQISSEEYEELSKAFEDFFNEVYKANNKIIEVMGALLDYQYLLIFGGQSVGQKEFKKILNQFGSAIIHRNFRQYESSSNQQYQLLARNDFSELLGILKNYFFHLKVVFPDFYANYNPSGALGPVNVDENIKQEFIKLHVLKHLHWRYHPAVRKMIDKIFEENYPKEYQQLKRYNIATRKQLERYNIAIKKVRNYTQDKLLGEFFSENFLLPLLVQKLSCGEDEAKKVFEKAKSKCLGDFLEDKNNNDFSEKEKRFFKNILEIYANESVLAELVINHHASFIEWILPKIDVKVLSGEKKSKIDQLRCERKPKSAFKLLRKEMKVNQILELVKHSVEEIKENTSLFEEVENEFIKKLVQSSNAPDFENNNWVDRIQETANNISGWRTEPSDEFARLSSGEVLTRMSFFDAHPVIEKYGLDSRNYEQKQADAQKAKLSAGAVNALTLLKSSGKGLTSPKKARASVRASSSKGSKKSATVPKSPGKGSTSPKKVRAPVVNQPGPAQMGFFGNAQASTTPLVGKRSHLSNLEQSPTSKRSKPS